MRKLALVVHATVTNDEAFQLGRLLPGKPFVKPAIVAAVNKGENKNSKTVATDAISQQSPQAEFKKAELKKAELKKEEIKKEDRVPSPRSKVRLRTSRAIFPLPT